MSTRVDSSTSFSSVERVCVCVCVCVAERHYKMKTIKIGFIGISKILLLSTFCRQFYKLNLLGFVGCACKNVKSGGYVNIYI